MQMLRNHKETHRNPKEILRNHVFGNPEENHQNFRKSLGNLKEPLENPKGMLGSRAVPAKSKVGAPSRRNARLNEQRAFRLDETADKKRASRLVEALGFRKSGRFAWTKHSL